PSAIQPSTETTPPTHSHCPFLYSRALYSIPLLPLPPLLYRNQTASGLQYHSLLLHAPDKYTLFAITALALCVWTFFGLFFFAVITALSFEVSLIYNCSFPFLEIFSRKENLLPG